MADPTMLLTMKQEKIMPWGMCSPLGLQAGRQVGAARLGVSGSDGRHQNGGRQACGSGRAGRGGLWSVGSMGMEARGARR